MNALMYLARACLPNVCSGFGTKTGLKSNTYSMSRESFHATCCRWLRGSIVPSIAECEVSSLTFKTLAKKLKPET